MKFLKRIALIAAFALASAGNANAQQFLDSPAQHLFDQASFHLEFDYFGPSKTDIKALLAKYQTEVDKACATEQQACKFETIEPLLEPMFAELEDGHAYYLTAKELQETAAVASGTSNSPAPRLGFTHIGFCETPNGQCKVENGKIVDKQIFDRMVVNVLPGSPAEKAGLHYGDRWTGYNGKTFNGADVSVEKFRELIAASETVTLSIVRGEKREKIDISTKGEIVNLVAFPTMEIRADGVAVLKIPDFLPEGVGAKINDLVKEAISKNVKAIVVDMRGNGGGSPVERYFALAAFMEKPIAIRRATRYNSEAASQIETFEGNSYKVSNSKGDVLGTRELPNHTIWAGPMALLVDENCASACEYFASNIQRAKRGQVIGEPTAGVGNTNTARLGLINGGAASIPLNQAFWLDGTSVPATIQPDIKIENYLFALFNTGRDGALEKALETLGIK